MAASLLEVQLYSQTDVEQRKGNLVLIQQIELPARGIKEMQAEARGEGYKFLETFVEEWESGENRFDRPGESLCGYLDDGVLVAIGGLNCDPFLGDPTVGRIRRVYVKQSWRNKGVGSALLDKLLSIGQQNFSSIRLRADNPAAARLYERKGFVRDSSATATHVLRFDSLR